MLRYQWEDVVRFWNSNKGEEKLKDKRVKYEATASSDSSVNLDDIDNRVITEVLGPERRGSGICWCVTAIRALGISVH
ncbi:hypothetical protein J1N35_037313 [Gossypium stocksii]|uniref:Uncharacterized protein n=1 Tax=Gossypium stocksii TaxID=47602 RepID=A0A9D3ULR8_9ROSI|nr:hypothetical protein J1N35_037313 [Gossypium stocksii]